MPLDGTWDLAFGPDRPADGGYDHRIVVPFAFQCAASGIGRDDPHEVVWYRTRFELVRPDGGHRVLLHFGAVDFEATVWLDGYEVGGHRGGHTSFTFDVTDALDGDRSAHELVVRAVDERRSDQLRGKQTATFPFMIHYRPTSGIWQPVWVELTGSAWIDELCVRAEADGTLSVAAVVGGDGAAAVRATLDLDGRSAVLEGELPCELTAVMAGVEPWSPDHPRLYGLDVELLDAAGATLDRVRSYVGFRTVAVVGDEWLLNGAPLRQRLLLDQGYWPETLLTPPSEAAIVTDLELVRAFGCNGVRKHQKIEDPRWLHQADRLGVLVWEELPSPFGIARVEGRLAEDAAAEWSEAIRRDRNHPCIVAWAPFNESWGIQGVHHRVEHQETVRRFVALTQALDPTRPVVDNSGWGHVDTDVVDVHDYDQDPAGLAARWTGIVGRGWRREPVDLEAEVGSFDLARWLEFAQVGDTTGFDWELLRDMVPDVTVWADGCAPEAGRAGPLVLSEFGGVGFAGTAEVRDRFDYAGAASADDLLERFLALVTAAESVPELRGWCWTQLADTEQEVNGLVTPDRRPKIDPAVVRAVLDALPWSTPGG